MDCKNWRKNRTPDKMRVNSLIDFLRDKTFVPGFLYVGKVSSIFSDDVFVYDGMHRFAAAKDIFLKHNIDLTCYIVMFETDNEDDIINHFVEINKSVPVPEIYKGNETQRTADIQTFIRVFTQKYTEFSKPSRITKRPNFNRDTLTDIISRVLIENKDYSPDTLLNILDCLNVDMKEKCENGHFKNVTAGIKEKCRTLDMYLFVDGLNAFEGHFAAFIDEHGL
jgi:hypothetical protein